MLRVPESHGQNSQWTGGIWGGEGSGSEGRRKTRQGLQTRKADGDMHGEEAQDLIFCAYVFFSIR